MAGRPRKTAAKPTKTLEQQLWDIDPIAYLGAEAEPARDLLV